MPSQKRQASILGTSPEALASLPTLEELGVGREFLEAAEEIADDSDVLGVERTRLEILVRFVVFWDRYGLRV